jgi:hypothetical protein
MPFGGWVFSALPVMECSAMNISYRFWIGV